MTVPTERYTAWAAGFVMPVMTWLMLATATGVGTSASGATSRDVRAAAMTKPMPLMKSATLITNSH
jgi:hypothetical protein